MLRRLTVSVLLLSLCASRVNAQGSGADPNRANIRQQVAALKWMDGPKPVPVFGVATVNLPEGYSMLGPEDTRRFMELSENPPSGATEYLVAPSDRRWFSVFEFSPDGYIKDNEKIDAQALLDAVRKGTEASNKLRRQKGWPEMTIVGWRYPPHYDNVTKHLEWAINAVSEGAAVVNFNTRILGRSGVTSAVLVVDPDALEASVKEFSSLVDRYQYIPGQKYSEFRAGDKTAEYGLAALIVGGAAAVATKAGFWKGLVALLAAGWKIVAAAFVALVGFVKNLFKRKKPDAALN